MVPLVQPAPPAPIELYRHRNYRLFVFDLFHILDLYFHFLLEIDNFHVLLLLLLFYQLSDQPSDQLTDIAPSGGRIWKLHFCLTSTFFSLFLTNGYLFERIAVQKLKDDTLMHCLTPFFCSCSPQNHSYLIF